MREAVFDWILFLPQDLFNPLRSADTLVSATSTSAMKADLHVHSRHSTQSGSLKFLRSRDCYSDPEAVYRTAKTRGMDVVTITDHDSIGGCLVFLERHPDATDFIVGEEVCVGFRTAISRSTSVSTGRPSSCIANCSRSVATSSTSSRSSASATSFSR